MKKILWLIFLVPIFMNYALANEIYYSDYSDFSDYQENIVEESDLVNVEKNIMYKWYKNTIEIGDYQLINSDLNFTDDCYETEYTEWSNIEPINTPEKIIFERDIYDYKLIEKIRYIHIYNLHGSYGAFRIPELQVFFDNKEIDYTFSCEGCWDNFDKYIHNYKYIENESYITNEGSLIIDLGEYYPVDKIKLIMYVFDLGDEIKKFSISYSKDMVNLLNYDDYSLDYSSIYLVESQKFEYQIKDIDNWLYEELTENKKEDNNIYDLSIKKEYRYKNKLCKTFKVNKEYYPDYSLFAIGDYNIKDSSKEFYRYQTRDKLELNVYDIINYDFDLNNFVVFSSSPYKIISDINYNKNGQYKINFITDNLNIEKIVNVKINENIIKEYEKQNEILSQQIKEEKEKYEELKKDFKVLENNQKNQFDDLAKINDNLINLYERVTISESVNNETIENLKKYLDSKLNDYNEIITNLKENYKKLADIIVVLQENDQDVSNEVEVLKQYKENYDKELNNIDLVIDMLNNKFELLETTVMIIDDIKNNQINLENKIDNIELKSNLDLKTKEELINIIEDLNKKYLNQITDLNNKLNNLNIITLNLENEIKQLDSFNIDNINENITTVFKKLAEFDLNKEKDEKLLEQKLNNYMLTIKGGKSVNLFGIYILIFLILICYIVYLLKKKSIKNNN